MCFYLYLSISVGRDIVVQAKKSRHTVKLPLAKLWKDLSFDFQLHSEFLSPVLNNRSLSDLVLASASFMYYSCKPFVPQTLLMYSYCKGLWCGTWHFPQINNNSTQQQTFFLFNLQFFYCCSSTVVCLFPPPQANTPALPTSLPVSTPHLVIVHVSFIIVPANPSPFPPEIPSPVPSGHCQPVLKFSVFGYILLACSF